MVGDIIVGVIGVLGVVVVVVLWIKMRKGKEFKASVGEIVQFPRRLFSRRK